MISPCPSLLSLNIRISKLKLHKEPVRHTPKHKVNRQNSKELIGYVHTDCGNHLRHEFG